MADDAFETVAITYSQPETAVILSMFAFYGIPAFAVGWAHAAVDWPMVVALGGVRIRVPADLVAEATGLLAEVEQQPAVIRQPVIDPGPARIILLILLFWIGGSIPSPVRTRSIFRRPESD